MVETNWQVEYERQKLHLEGMVQGMEFALALLEKEVVDDECTGRLARYKRWVDAWRPRRDEW